MSPSARKPPAAVRPDEVAALQDVSLRLTRRLRKHSRTELTLSQMSALSTLKRVGPMRLGELARREQISKSSVTKLVTRLDEMGYLRRQVDPDDGRSFHITITDHGHRLLEDARTRANEFLGVEVGLLPADDQHAILAALPALQRLVAPRDPEPVNAVTQP